MLLKMHGATTLAYCYQCGTCSGGCPVAKVTGGKYNPRRIIEKSLLGLKEKLVADPGLWLCTLCDTCDEACPQNVMLTEIFTVLKNMAVKQGNAPEAIKAQATTLWENGITIPYNDAIIRRRKEMGLADTAPAPPVDELQAIMEDTGFKTIVESFTKDTGGNTQ